MVERVGIIGVGLLASYLVEGLRKAAPDLEILLSRYMGEETDRLVSEFGALPVEDNQGVAAGAELILVTTRPGDLIGACEAVAFQPYHTVVSTAVGVPLASLQLAVEPATASGGVPHRELRSRRVTWTRPPR